MTLSDRVLKGAITVVFFIAALFLIHSHAGANTSMKAVKSSEVCMVNDTCMGKPQIPVQAEGRTYYGCCEGYVGRIRGGTAVRFA